MLFALDDTDLRIVQVSENTLGLLGMGPHELLGRSIEEVIGADRLELLSDATARGTIEDLNPLAMSIASVRGRLPVDAILHTSTFMMTPRTSGGLATRVVLPVRRTSREFAIHED